jgi:hypothetical protein
MLSCDEPQNVPPSFKICTAILDKGEVIPGLNQAPCHEDIHWSRCVALPLLTLTLVGGELLPAHTPAALLLRMQPAASIV